MKKQMTTKEYLQAKKDLEYLQAKKDLEDGYKDDLYIIQKRYAIQEKIYEINDVITDGTEKSLC